MIIKKLVPTFVAMYFKVSLRTNPLTGNTDGYRRLVESYRNAAGRICHRTMLNVGFMGDIEPEDLNRIQKLLNYKCQKEDKELFEIEYEKETPIVQKWVKELYFRLVKEKRIDVGNEKSRKVKTEEDWETINMKSLRNKDVREVGGEWVMLSSARTAWCWQIFIHTG